MKDEELVDHALVSLWVVITALDHGEEEAIGDRFEDADHSIRRQVGRLPLDDPLLDVQLNEQVSSMPDGGKTWVPI